jgi:heme A synthase
MTDFILSAHAGWQYVALLSVVVSLVFAFREAGMTTTAETTYRVTAVAVDIQVLLGIIVWVAESGWDLGLAQGWIHPIAGLGALGVLHAFIGRARKADRSHANQVVRTGLIVAVILVLVAIGIGEMA